MATLQQCIDAFRTRMAARDPSEPIRIVRVAMVPTRRWREGDSSLDRLIARPYKGSNAARCASLADTGDQLGLARVGLVIDSAETVS